MQETSVQKLIQVKENRDGYIAAITVNKNRVVYAMASSQQDAVDSLIYKVR